MSKKMIMLRSSDGVTFEVDETVAMMSVSIQHMIEDDCARTAIPVIVTADILSKVLEYCRRYVELSSESQVKDKSEFKKWEKEFMDVDSDTLSELAKAANYLGTEELLEIICEKIAGMIRGKSTAEMRKILNLNNDFTPEEEQAIKKDFTWAFL